MMQRWKRMNMADWMGGEWLHYFWLSRLFGLTTQKHLLRGIFRAPCLWRLSCKFCRRAFNIITALLPKTAEQSTSLHNSQTTIHLTDLIDNPKSASSQVMRRDWIRGFLTPLPNIFSSFFGQQNLQKVTAIPTHFRKLYTCKFSAKLRF